MEEGDCINTSFFVSKLSLKYSGATGIFEKHFWGKGYVHIDVGGRNSFHLKVIVYSKCFMPPVYVGSFVMNFCNGWFRESSLLKVNRREVAIVGGLTLSE